MLLMQTYCYNFQFTRNTNNGETSLKKYNNNNKKYHRGGKKRIATKNKTTKKKPEKFKRWNFLQETRSGFLTNKQTKNSMLAKKDHV